MLKLLLLICCCLAGLAHADGDILQRFNQLMADPAQREQAYQAGHERIVLCGNCHGVDGNSTRTYIPNLAEQNPVYLFNSFEKFADGRRSHYVMSRLAQVLTPDDRINVAVYYSQQTLTPRPQEGTPAQRQQGEALFQRICVACHGARGEGMHDTPRLAGQPAEYLRHTLGLFRSDDPSRAGSVMIGVAALLSASDVDALAVYLNGLQL